jgi:hypothetical protein
MTKASVTNHIGMHPLYRSQIKDVFCMDFLTKWVNSLYLIQLLCQLSKMVFKNARMRLKEKSA